MDENKPKSKEVEINGEHGCYWQYNRHLLSVYSWRLYLHCNRVNKEVYFHSLKKMNRHCGSRLYTQYTVAL